MSIGERLKEERVRLGLNQTDFAELAGVRKNAQSNYEKDERAPDARYLAAVAAAGVDVLYVVTGMRAETAAGLAPEEAALLDNYRHADDAGRASLDNVSRALATSKEALKKQG